MKKIFAFVTLLLGLPNTTFAHVRYMVNEAETSLYGGPDYTSLLSPLSEPLYVWMMVATALAVLFLYSFLDHNKIFHKWADHMATVGESYKTYIPWITRLSLGIILISGGTSNFLLSPVLETGSHFIGVIQLVIGFFLMAGFMTGLSAVLSLLLFFFALSQDIYLIGSFDILALILSLFILDSRRPGIDDIIGIPDFLHIKKLRQYLPTILRVGIGISMAYLALVEKIFAPNLAAFVAKTTNLVDVIPVSAEMWAFSAGVIELLVGLVLIVGFKTRLTAVVAIFILSMSFFYFGEDVTSHVTLFGTLSAVFILGVGPLGIDKVHPKDDHLK